MKYRVLKVCFLFCLFLQFLNNADACFLVVIYCEDDLNRNPILASCCSFKSFIFYGLFYLYIFCDFKRLFGWLVKNDDYL